MPQVFTNVNDVLRIFGGVEHILNKLEEQHGQSHFSTVGGERADDLRGPDADGFGNLPFNDRHQDCH